MNIKIFFDEFGDERLDLSGFKSSAPTMRPNKLLIPVTELGFDDEGIAIFNAIYTFIRSHRDRMNEFTYTASQGISTKQGNISGEMWGVTNTHVMVELDYRDPDGKYYRFIITNKNGYDEKDPRQKVHRGRNAFRILAKELKKDGVILKNLAIDNGLEVKATIPKQRIGSVVSFERTYTNVHHCDINHAYPAGMMREFPELRPTFERLAELRKTSPEIKNVFNMSQGVFQSKIVGYQYSHIAKAGYVYTNEMLDIMSKKLEDSGYRIIGYNTDGIWYQDIDFIGPYSDETFGAAIGQWKTDHVGCSIRYKSHGSYEYIENGKYTPVVRGLTNLDILKPDRSTWEWGDIFKCSEKKVAFYEDVGMVMYDAEDYGL